MGEVRQSRNSCVLVIVWEKMVISWDTGAAKLLAVESVLGEKVTRAKMMRAPPPDLPRGTQEARLPLQG